MVPTAAIRPSSAIATAPSAIGSPSTGTTQSAETTLRVSSLPACRSPLPALLHHHGDPDGELVEDEQRHGLEHEGDRIDGREEDREREHGDIPDAAGSSAGDPTESTPRRTRPSTKIGISKAIPNASSVSATKDRK